MVNKTMYFNAFSNFIFILILPLQSYKKYL